MLNGKAISTTLLSRDTYGAMTRIVLRGTKKVSNTNSEVTKEQKNETNIQEQQIQNSEENQEVSTPEEENVDNVNENTTEN